MSESLIDSLAIALLPGVTATIAAEAVAALGAPCAIFDAGEAELRAVGFPLRAAQVQQIETARRRAEEELNYASLKGLDIITWDSPLYPTRLLAAQAPPAAIFTNGFTDLNHLKTVGIVGTRHATPYGVGVTKSLVNRLAESVPDCAIISGLAYGIDIEAHKAALEAGLSTIGVVAHGLATLYPAMHRDYARRMIDRGGMVMTEYTHLVPAHRENFLSRNRLVAALSDVLVVAESGLRGGALSTARHASTAGRRVFALPGRVSDPYSHGCNNLISRGEATLLDDASTITDAMGWTTPDTSARLKSRTQSNARRIVDSLEPGERLILRLIHEAGDTADSQLLCSQCDLGTPTIMTLLIGLEMKDIILSLPGNRYKVATDFPVNLLIP